jgi:hypothetical protein
MTPDRHPSPPTGRERGDPQAQDQTMAVWHPRAHVIGDGAATHQARSGGRYAFLTPECALEDATMLRRSYDARPRTMGEDNPLEYAPDTAAETT